LKEKDEILFKLNTGIDEQKQKTKALEEKLNDITTQMKEKDAIIGVLRTQISTSLQSTDDASRCETDAEKECFRLKEELKKVHGSLEKSMGEKRVIELSLDKSRQSLDEAMCNWGQERNALQRDVNVLEEKVRMYEAYNRMDRDETIDTLKMEVHDYFKEKEALACELSAVKMKAEGTERNHKEQLAKLQGELSDKLRLLKQEVDNNVQMNTELDRLRRQVGQKSCLPCSLS
jgi:chromosome segregation ATPase